MYRVDPLSHTADVGYEVRADALGELFRGAAAGLAYAVRGEEPPRPSGPTGDDRGSGTGPGSSGDGEGVESLSIDRPDRERLLVAWLRELLYRMTGEGRFPEAVEVEMTGPSALRARVRWSAADEGGRVAREIKGVTYHGLRVDRDDDGRWHARLVLDV